MSGKPATPREKASTSSNTDPVAKAGDYKSIAARYAKAKALKEKEDAIAKKKARDGGKLNGQILGNRKVKGPMTAAERMNKRREDIFRKAWNLSLGFFIWLL